MRRWLLRSLLFLAVILLAAEALYLPTANLYLNGARLRERLNRHPEKFAIRWEKAWTPWPGRVHLRNVEIRGLSSHVDWYAHIDTLVASYGITPLLRRRVHLSHVRAAGLDYRHRRVTTSEPTDAATQPGLPPLPDLTMGTKQWPEINNEAPTGAGGSRRKPWTISADDIDIAIAQLWFDRYRMAGPMNLDTAMELIAGRTIEFPRIHFTMDRGDVTIEERAMLGGLLLDIESTLPPFGREGRKLRDVVQHLTGRFRLQADSASLFFLETYLKRAPWLHFNSNVGLHADLRLEEGLLMEGSTLVSTPGAINVDFLDHKLTGNGRIAMRVEKEEGGPLSRLEASMQDFELSVPDQSEPYARGRGFEVVATSTALALDDLFTKLEVTADLEEAVIRDLSHYNRYLPRDSGLSIREGTGRISYHIEADQDEMSLHGWTGLSASDGVLMFEGYQLRGDVTIHTTITSADLENHWFDISGTTIDLVSRNFPWKAAITLPKARVRYSEPMQLDTRAVFRMTDTAPLVALFNAKNDISSFIERLMTIKDIQGAVNLRVSERGAQLAGLQVTGEDFLALADLALHERGKDGILYVKLRAISFGVAFDKGKKDLDLIRARKWFERERAKRRGSDPPAR